MTDADAYGPVGVVFVVLNKDVHACQSRLAIAPARGTRSLRHAEDSIVLGTMPNSPAIVV
jgi:hypothetical protein